MRQSRISLSCGYQHPFRMGNWGSNGRRESIFKTTRWNHWCLTRLFNIWVGSTCLAVASCTIDADSSANWWIQFLISTLALTRFTSRDFGSKTQIRASFWSLGRTTAPWSFVRLLRHLMFDLFRKVNGGVWRLLWEWDCLWRDAVSQYWVWGMDQDSGHKSTRRHRTGRLRPSLLWTLLGWCTGTFK